MSNYKQCPNGHYYQGDHCPYCKTPVQRKVITIGRSIDNDCVINSPFVKRHHCQITQDESGQYSILDLGSSNGTYVNGIRITGSTPLNLLDVIRVGDQLAVGWQSHFGGGANQQPLGGEIPMMGMIELEERNNTDKEEKEETGYKLCPNGHYYQGDHCPFCPEEDAPTKKEYELKGCNNLHAYDAELDKCPICGSSIVIDGFRYKSSDTMLITSIRLKRPVIIKAGEKSLECNFIEIMKAAGWIFKYSYSFSTSDDWRCKDEIAIEPDSEIQFGGTVMMGKDFIRICDLVLENRLSDESDSTVAVNPDDLIQLHELFKRLTGEQDKTQKTPRLVYGHNVFTSTLSSDNVPVFHVKVCPEGHGYDSSLQLCPFCGSEVVASEVNARAGITLGITNLPFEKDGARVLCDFAEVDGHHLTGVLCMRLVNTGVFKYAYYVAQEGEDGGAILINPESHVRLYGDGFSETLTGREFYKICDLVFDKHEKA